MKNVDGVARMSYAQAHIISGFFMDMRRSSSSSLVRAIRGVISL